MIPAYSLQGNPLKAYEGEVTLTLGGGVKVPDHHLFSDKSFPAFSARGLRAESARAFTGRRNSHSGKGEDFLTGQQIFFTETAVTLERKVEKLFPRWEINRHAEG